MPVAWSEKPGLADAIAAAGHWIEGRPDGLVHSSDDAAVQAIIDGFDVLVAARTAKLAELAAHRWDVQNAGFEIGGITFLTDVEARSNLAAAALAAMLSAQVGDPYTVTWKSPHGPIELDGAQVMGAARAMEAWVRGLFTREATLAARIAAMTDWQAVTAMDVAALWAAAT
jgi:hypothetical protein